MYIAGEQFYPVWLELLENLIGNGRDSKPRGLPTYEIMGVSVRVHFSQGNILYHPVRNLNYKFMVAEWLWIMAGSNDLEEIAQYNSEMHRFSDEGTFLYGAYGPRLMHQIPWIVEKLKEPHTRQAVATIWQPKEAVSKDVPCTVALQFLWRDGRVNLIVTMRSSDIWLGLPYDFFVFSQLLNCVCSQCGNSKPGFVQFNLGSSHLYESNLEASQRLVNESTSGETIVSPRMPGMPPGILLEAMRTPQVAAKTMVSLSHPWSTYFLVLMSPKGEAIGYLTT